MACPPSKSPVVLSAINLRVILLVHDLEVLRFHNDKNHLSERRREIEFLNQACGLIVLNDNISQTFFSCSIENDLFKYTGIETYPSLYVAEYKKHFDYKAYESIYKEYIRLLKNSNSESSNR